MSDGQYDLEAIMDYVKSTGKPLLADENSDQREGAYFIDTGIAAKLNSYRRLCVSGVLPEVAGQLMESNTIRFFGDQVFVKEPNTPGVSQTRAQLLGDVCHQSVRWPSSRGLMSRSKIAVQV